MSYNHLFRLPKKLAPVAAVKVNLRLARAAVRAVVKARVVARAVAVARAAAGVLNQKDELISGLS